MRTRHRFRPPRSLRATRAGWCFIAIVFGVGFASLNTGNNLLYLVFALMLAFLVLSGLLSESSLRGIRIERHLPRELFAGTANRVILRVHNVNERAASFALSIEDHIETPSGTEGAGRCFALRVGAGEDCDRRYAFEPRLRGDLRFDSIRISTRFPFGLFAKSVELDMPESVLVYPAVHPVPIAPQKTDEGLDEDDRPGLSRDGDEVTGLREHTPGDSLARVHWRHSLRARKLLVGEREGLALSELEVQLELPPQLPQTIVEDRVSMAASEIVNHMESGLRVGLRTRAAWFPPNTGFAHRGELLRFLARVTPEAAGEGPGTTARREWAR
ncbi:MAG: hypothetical protein CL908_08040 [Deltaproteobacteria bacterium]|nr:hypothetical protein [Deltaproteobacteria bacterium]